jgi:hypothetical protein
MTETVGEAAHRLGIKGQDGIKQVKRMIRRLLDKHKLAADLFLDDDGQVKPAAARWFRQLASDNYLDTGAWHQDPREHAYREGRRAVALEIIRSARLDAERLDRLVELERDMK